MTEISAQPKNPERLELEQLTALQPGLARLMPEIGARFWKAFYAARAGNWPLASWQLREMRKLLRLCEVTRPKYTDDIEEWIADDLGVSPRMIDEDILGPILRLGEAIVTRPVDAILRRALEYRDRRFGPAPGVE